MSMCQDKQVKGLCIFLLCFALLMPCMGLAAGMYQIHLTKSCYISHDEAIASSLLDQGVTKNIVACALTNTEVGKNGRTLLQALGISNQTQNNFLDVVYRLQKSMIVGVLGVSALLLVVLFTGISLFFWQRKKLYLSANDVLAAYLEGDYSRHLPQTKEGAIFQIFFAIEQLATMLQAKNEAERSAKEFLKHTISDISHQLKTPLSALTMYQEIIHDEPDHPETVKEFSAKIEISLKRMEQLIGAMLKITRLDAGNILFEKKACPIKNLIADALNELTVRAAMENKEISVDGDISQVIVCDRQWTAEAIGNIVKNALDHTEPGDVIQIIWERTPAMLCLSIADHGHGIAEEDIHHIFKRFYRSKHSLDTQGVGLGLPLAKSIIEGQGGMISVQSKKGEGTSFMLSFKV